MAGLQVLDEDGDVDEILDDALVKARARGTLLSTEISIKDEEICYYVINSERGRTFIDQVNTGKWRPNHKGEIDILPARPTLYTLYEQNIGVLTPMIVDSIKDAEKEYPTEWIEEAIQHAVERNARSWKYIVKLLETWKQEGRVREAVREDHQTN